MISATIDTPRKLSTIARNEAGTLLVMHAHVNEGMPPHRDCHKQGRRRRARAIVARALRLVDSFQSESVKSGCLANELLQSGFHLRQRAGFGRTSQFGFDRIEIQTQILQVVK